MSEPSQPIAYTFEVPSRPEAFVITHRQKRPYWLHLLLLLLTMLTTLIVGAQLNANFLRGLPAFTVGDELMPLFHPKWIWQQPSRILMGVPFSVALMAILLAHEFGHFLLCEKYGVNATLPFFIPAPTLIGTMGAFIRIKSPIRSRRALFDIGVAGPIAGFVVAVPLLFLGLCAINTSGPSHWSREPGDWLPSRLPSRALDSVTNSERRSLESLALHPIAVAAWVGMFATALEPASRWPARWRTHHLRVCASVP